MTDLERMTQQWRAWRDGQKKLVLVPELLVALIREEREACAKIADAVAVDKRNNDFDGIRKGTAQGIAEGIRQRTMKS